jgi:peroxiredoxin
MEFSILQILVFLLITGQASMKKITITLLSVLFCGSMFIHNAYAMDIFTTPSASQVEVGDTLTVDIYLQNDDIEQSVNALAGEYAYSSELLRVKTISVNGSIINGWIVSPFVVEEGKITWSGIIPGGFAGTQDAFTSELSSGLLMSITFQAVREGDAYFSFSNIQAHQNDSVGTLMNIVPQISTVHISFSTKKLIDNASSTSSVSDQSTGLDVQVIKNTAGNSQKWFVTFVPGITSMIDVSAYQIIETHQSDPDLVLENAWKSAQSPYELQNQDRTSYVHIKYRGLNGKEYIYTLQPVTGYSKWGILKVLLCAIIFFVFGYLWKKRYI